MGINYCLTLTPTAVDTLLMILGQQPVLEKVKYDATAVIDVPAYLFKDLFFFQSDNYDFIDDRKLETDQLGAATSKSDVTYCCIPDNWPLIAFDQATVTRESKVTGRALNENGPNDYTTTAQTTKWGHGKSNNTTGMPFNKDVAAFCVSTFLGLGSMDILKNEQELVTGTNHLNEPIKKSVQALLTVNGGSAEFPRGNYPPSKQTDSFGEYSNNYARQMFISALESDPSEFLKRLADQLGKWKGVDANGTTITARPILPSSLGPPDADSPWLNIPIEAGDTVTIYVVIGAGNKLEVQGVQAAQAGGQEHAPVPFYDAYNAVQSSNPEFQVSNIGNQPHNQTPIDFIPNVPQKTNDGVSLVDGVVTADLPRINDQFPVGSLSVSGTNAAATTFEKPHGLLYTQGAGKVHAWRVYEMKMTMTDDQDPNEAANADADNADADAANADADTANADADNADADAANADADADTANADADNADADAANADAEPATQSELEEMLQTIHHAYINTQTVSSIIPLITEYLHKGGDASSQVLLDTYHYIRDQTMYDNIPWGTGDQDNLIRAYHNMHVAGKLSFDPTLLTTAIRGITETTSAHNIIHVLLRTSWNVFTVSDGDGNVMAWNEYVENARLFYTNEKHAIIPVNV